MALIRISENWRSIGIAEFEKRQLERMWDQLGKKQKEKTKPVAKPTSTPTRSYNGYQT